MFDLQILMPMGGVGDRFRRAGNATPGPLIDVLGVPMFKRALSSFDPLDANLKITVVIREDHEREFGLASR